MMLAIATGLNRQQILKVGAVFDAVEDPQHMEKGEFKQRRRKKEDGWKNFLGPFRW